MLKYITPARDFVPLDPAGPEILVLQPRGVVFENDAPVVAGAGVDARGEITGRPTVSRGSGSSRLDAAALSWASESLRFQPATSAGTAIAACKGFRVKFALK
jgi:hypothetical protein